MVPVRWMPPESILEGYFSAASDVWYEIQSIITNERNLHFATSIVTHKHESIKRFRTNWQTKQEMTSKYYDN